MNDLLIAANLDKSLTGPALLWMTPHFNESILYYDCLTPRSLYNFLFALVYYLRLYKNVRVC